MNIAKALLIEWQHEAAQTRKILAKVPADKLDWRPHEKSMTLGHLASHLGFACELFANAVVNNTHYAWSGEKQHDATSTEELLAVFDKQNAAVQQALERFKEEDALTIWSFGPKEKPIMQLPKASALRAFVFSHMIHHRGQLSVYLRLLDVSVPGMYGPSADEKA